MYLSIYLSVSESRIEIDELSAAMASDILVRLSRLEVAPITKRDDVSHTAAYSFKHHSVEWVNNRLDVVSSFLQRSDSFVITTGIAVRAATTSSSFWQYASRKHTDDMSAAVAVHHERHCADGG